MANTLDLNKFIPKFLLNLFQRNSFFNNAYLLGQRGPIWISVVEPYELYNRIPELRAVIDRDANMFANMKLYKRDKKTKKIIEDAELDKLLDNPNCTQSQNQWLKQYRQQILCYGNQFIYKNQGSIKQYPIALWNVSPYYLQPILTGKLFQQTEMNGIISGYKFINTMAIGDMIYASDNFKTEEILYTRINDLNNPIIGKSPIACLQYPLSNIEMNYKARNVAHQHVGVGIVSPDIGKDMAGSMPLNPVERKKMEDQFGNDYGINLDQRKTILSNTAVKFQSMGIETNKMILIDEIEANIRPICNQFHINPQIFMGTSTYENLRSAFVQTYQDNIIPAAEEFAMALSPFLNLKPNEELCTSFEHLSILKENKLMGMQAIESIVKSLTQAVQGGILDAKLATEILSKELGLSAASY